MGLPKGIYTYGLPHKNKKILRSSLKRKKKEEADKEFLVYVRLNVCMLQKEKVFCWSQYSSFPHIFKTHLLSVSCTSVILGDRGADLPTKWRKTT